MTMKIRVEIEAMGWTLSREWHGFGALVVVLVIMLLGIGGC